MQHPTRKDRSFLVLLAGTLRLGCASRLLGPVLPLLACERMHVSTTPGYCPFIFITRSVYVRCCLLAFSIFVACPYLTSL